MGNRNRSNKRKRRPGPKRTSNKNRRHTTDRRRGNYAVYVISSGDRLKIGFTRSSVADRLKSLQTGSPYPLSLLAQFRHFNPVLLEKFLHSVLDENRVSGEWFDCSVERVREVVAVVDDRLDVNSVHGEWSALCIELGGKRLVEVLEPSKRQVSKPKPAILSKRQIQARRRKAFKTPEGVIRSDRPVLSTKEERDELERLKRARAYNSPQSRYTKRKRRKRRKRKRQSFDAAARQDAAANMNRKREAPPIQT